MYITKVELGIKYPPVYLQVWGTPNFLAVSLFSCFLFFDPLIELKILNFPSTCVFTYL